MILVRFILRFLLVPFGACIAAIIAVFVVSFAHWSRFLKLVTADPQASEDILLALIFVGPLVVLTLAIGALAMLLPAAIGVVISEAFALRSWIFHTGNGALASLIGWLAMQDLLRPYELFSDPTISVGAGVCAGIAYWAVAGWSAGFWKPVFARGNTVPPASSPPTVAPA
jgi:hypothetical protein